jgi:hypothetical protein
MAKHRKPRAWKILNWAGFGKPFWMAQVDSSGSAMLAHVGWTLEDAERLHEWLGKFIKWKRQQPK